MNEINIASIKAVVEYAHKTIEFNQIESKYHYFSSFLVKEAKTKLENIEIKSEAFIDAETLKVAANEIKPLIQQNSDLKDELRSVETQAIHAKAKLGAAEAELEELKTNREKAYSNFSHFAQELVTDRNTKVRELKEIDSKLSIVGKKQLENSGWGRMTLAVAISLAIACGLLYVLSRLATETKPLEPHLEITYDISKMIESLLLGSGALIAGVAYAISVLRGNRDQ